MQICACHTNLFGSSPFLKIGSKKDLVIGDFGILDLW
jgi:hypothetical protein